MSEHYVIKIEIEKVTKTPDPRIRTGGSADTPERREVDEVTKIIVKAPSLEAAYDKAHRLLGADENADVEVTSQ